jgi:glyoxylase-like metal-dependent hydrolase (beta-lactamase superfamily II)
MKDVIDLEGRALVVVEVGHTDTDHTTCLYVPSVGLVVAGDASYNDVHHKMLEVYPDRANPGSLWGSARAAKP